MATFLNYSSSRRSRPHSHRHLVFTAQTLGGYFLARMLWSIEGKLLSYYQIIEGDGGGSGWKNTYPWHISLCVLEAEIYSQMEFVSTGYWRCLHCLCMMSKTNMFFHVEGKHMKSSGYNCIECGKFCSTLKALNIHKSRFHKTQKRWKILNNLWIYLSFLKVWSLEYIDHI